jgi:CheY-like chemotaxis protein
MTKKILVVDDSKVVGKLLATTLTAQGHETLNAISVDEAIAILKDKGPIQLVITDLIMPDKDGIELIDHIHNTMSHYDRPKIIVISGGSKGTVTAETAVQSVKDRVDKVMSKPFTQDVLISAVNGLLK